MLLLESLVIVTGLSGSGKTSALKILEDMEYITMDNLPCQFGENILKEYLINKKNRKIKKVALGVDIRSFDNIEEYIKLLDMIGKLTEKSEIIFLEASDTTILNRYNLTRRKHPLEKNTLLESIQREKEIMSVVRERSNIIIDTSDFSYRQLCEKIKINYYTRLMELNEINIHIQSFGFKYGVPIDIDLVFDVRFLPNPYYVLELKEKTGNDKEIFDYVQKTEVFEQFYLKLTDLLEFLIPNYIKEGKKHLSIGIGCSGGKHRSVVITNLLYEKLAKINSVKTYKSHREFEKGNWER